MTRRVLIGLFFVSLAFQSINVFAEEVTCTLKSSDKQASLTIDLSKTKNSGDADGYKTPVLDIFFNLEVECENGACVGAANFSSQMAEDQIDEAYFEFERYKKLIGLIFEKDLDYAPDGSIYSFYCSYSL